MNQAKTPAVNSLPVAGPPDELLERIFKVMRSNPGTYDLEAAQLWRGQSYGPWSEKLTGALELGLGTRVPDVDWSTTDGRVIRYLYENVHVFSGAKTFQELRTMSELLVGNGKVTEFQDFKRLVREIHAEYSERWLLTEYNTTLAKARTVSQWQSFPDDALLEFRTAGDSRVRREHERLDKTRLPKSDPWWDRHTPPLGYNCRCDIRWVLDGGKPTAPDRVPVAPIGKGPGEVHPMFANNPAKTGTIFPDTHPYYRIAQKYVAKTGLVRPFMLPSFQRFRADRKGFASFLDEAVQAEQPRGKSFTIGFINELLEREMIRKLKIRPQTAQVVIDDKAVFHALRPRRSGEATPDRRLLRLLPSMIENAELVLYNKREGSLLYAKRLESGDYLVVAVKPNRTRHKVIANWTATSYILDLEGGAIGNYEILQGQL